MSSPTPPLDPCRRSGDQSGPGRTNGKRSPGDGKDAPTQAELLVRIAQKMFRFCRDTKGDPFAVRLQPPRDAIRLHKSAEVRALLAYEYRRRFGTAVGARAIDDAISQLMGEAYAAKKERIFLRVAPSPGGFAIDAGDDAGSVVVVTRDGWNVSTNPPVTFRRNELTRPMRVPEPGGTFELLRRHFRVAAEDFDLFCAYLVSLYFSDRARPILLLMGGQGTGKSTAAKLIGALIDPSAVPLHSPPRDLDSWVLVASSAMFIALDNVSDVPQWLSDALCRSTSGDGQARRQLYTDGELRVFNVLAAVAVTSIEPGALRGDLGDRVLQLAFEPFPTGQRREERKVLKALAADAPKIRGAILDAAAAVLRRIDDVRLNDPPRMADFATILQALDDEYGFRSLPRYLEKRNAFAKEVAFGDFVVSAVAQLIGADGTYEGTASDLLGRLDPYLGANGRRSWNASSLGRALRRAADSLKVIGITFESTKSPDGSERRVRLYRTPQNAVRPVRPSDGIQQPERVQADGTDTTDSSPATADANAKASAMAAEYSRVGTMVHDDLMRFFRKRVASSNELHALSDLAGEIERRRRGRKIG
jgi:hypothetical protein